MKKLYYLYADFETTRVDLPKQYKTYSQYYKDVDNAPVPKIYSWAVVHNNDFSIDYTHPNAQTMNRDGYYFTYGINTNDCDKSFISFIESIDKDVLMYFNNLKGFDGHYLIPLLDKHGYSPLYPYEMKDNELFKDKINARIEKIKTIIEKMPKKGYLKNLDTFKKHAPEQYKKLMESEIKKKWKTLMPYEYTVLTNNNTQIYEIKIGIESSKKTKGVSKSRAVIIRDNLLLFPSSIKEMGITITQQKLIEMGYDPTTVKDFLKGVDTCKEFEEIKNKYMKKTIDYKKYELYKSLKEFEEDKQELEYLEQDVFILWEFHNQIEQYFKRNKWRMTIGSTAYKQWEENIGKKLTDLLIEKGEVETVTLTRGATRYRYKDKLYDHYTMYKKAKQLVLPVTWLDSEENGNTVYSELHKWYGGGISHVNEQHRGTLVKNVTILDINSSYPSQQVKDVNVPFGIPIKGNKKGYDFKFYELVPLKDIESKNCLPFLWDIYSDTREYTTKLYAGKTYLFTSISYENVFKYYDLKKGNHKLKIKWSFKSTPISSFFKSFVNEWYTIKENASLSGDVIVKLIAKLFLNSVYGKFGTRDERTSKLWIPEMEQWENYTEKVPSKYYLPMGICITELARNSLVDAVGHNYKDFIYCDTDSIAIIDFDNKNYNLELDGSQLGSWDIEFTNGYGIYRRAKQYLLFNGKSVKKAFAGINFNRLKLIEEDEQILKDMKELSLYDMVLGKKITHQLIPSKVLGYGVLLNDNSEKDIKPIWDYKPYLEQKRFLEKHYEQTLIDIAKLEKELGTDLIKEKF